MARKMSSKTISVEIFQCDHVHDDGERCKSEGERMSIKSCALCQKDIKDAPKHYAHFVGGGFAAVLVEDREIANERLSEADNYGILPVGPECARKIGRGFLYSAEEAEKLRRS